MPESVTGRNDKKNENAARTDRWSDKKRTEVTDVSIMLELVKSLKIGIRFSRKPGAN